MRKWHRWLGIVFALVMLWVALTGVLSYAAEWWPANAPGPGAAVPAGFHCPEGWRCLPPRPTSGPRAWVGYLHHLHSGEELGLGGQVLVFLSGLALTFFAVSGVWMYLKMWRGRRGRGGKGLFWH